MTGSTFSPAAVRADRIFFHWVFPALLVGIFLVYATFRQRYIGATDWFGYYQQGELLKTGRVFLPTELPCNQYPAIVPLGYVVMGSHAVPQYTPGFPVLLAAASFARLTFFVPPIIGLVSCWLLFLLLRDFTERWIAAVFTLAWAFFPIVVFGSTTLMSDLVAATAVMGAYLAYRRGQLLLSAWVLGYSFCVRPTNVLFLAVFLLPLARDRRLIRYGLYLLGPVLLYSLYNYRIYGSPLRTGYADFRSDLTSDVFSQHFGFYLWYTLAQCTPVIIALALWGLWPFSREKLFQLLWFTVFLVFYSFWYSGGDRWWWTRFLLPGYPAIFVLAACGLARLRESLRSWTGVVGWTVVLFLPFFYSWYSVSNHWRWPRFLLLVYPLIFPLATGLSRISLRSDTQARGSVRWNGCICVMFASIALLPWWQIHFGLEQQDLWERNKGHSYHDIVERVAALVPPHSFVGSVEFGGSFRVYTSLTGFVSVFDTTPSLINEGLRQKREVYLLVEPWNLKHSNILALLQRFPAEKVAEIAEPTWGELPLCLYRLHAPDSKLPPARL